MTVLDVHICQVQLPNVFLTHEFESGIKEGTILIIHIEHRLAFRIEILTVKVMLLDVGVRVSVDLRCLLIIRLHICANLYINAQLLVDNVGSQLAKYVLQRYIFLE